MAKAAPKKASEIDINLLKAQGPERRGQAVSWILNVGRYLIIVTEIIALAIFLLSIKLSADKNNLSKDIQDLSIQVAAQEEFENEFRNTQKRIQEVGRLKASHFETNQVVSEFLKLLPKGMTLTSFAIGGDEFGENELRFSGEFDNPPQLQTLVVSFSGSNKIVGLDIKDLSHPNDDNPRYTFSAVALINRAGFARSEEN